MQVVYLDNNATTKPDPQVVAAMVPFLQELYGNPSSAHRFGQRSRQAIDEARAQLADFLGCSDRELIFTGGGTEASNTAFRSLLAARAPRTVVVTSTVEHSATKQMCEKHVDAGLDVRSVGVHDDGTLDMDALASALDDDVAFCTMMWANNETGVLFDVAQIADICREKGVPFHCDATQALGKIPADFHRLGFDMATIASHKFHGPKGVGALFVRKGLRVDPLLVGGPQERARRGGTENVPGIVGLGKAAEVAKDKLPDMARVEKVLFNQTWYQIRVPEGVTSYVSKAFVNAQGDGETGTINQDRTPVKAASLRGPGESYREQLLLSKDDTVTILAEEGNYYKVVSPKDAFVFIPAGTLRKA
ncbi:MAG: aminotransferase class V-fold PLP-dependent enzyme, partial [Planctomycetota bacterium]